MSSRVELEVSPLRPLNQRKSFVMQTKSILGPLAAALICACSLGCKESVPDVSPGASPAPTAAADIPLQLPILFDYRQVLAVQDISGLPEGEHSFDLDLYAPIEAGWTPAAERLVQEAIRVVHVDTQRDARLRVTLGPEGKTGARRVHVDAELGTAGSWVVMLGQGLVAAHADPELLAHYAIPDAKTLKRTGDYEFLHPNLMLRTVGHCNHVHEVVTKVDETGTLRTVELHFSEPVDKAALAGGLQLGFTDVDGRRGRAADAEQVTVTGDVVAIHVPALRDQTGTLDIPLARIRGFAGTFREDLSCREGDGSLGVGIASGSQEDGEHVVSPLRAAASRALGEDRK